MSASTPRASAFAARRYSTSRTTRLGGLSSALGMLKMQEEIVVHVDLMFGAMEPSHQARRRAAGPM
jgi:hypothetical protein